MRARGLKPALFKNEVLGVADPLAIILFIGLWCLADREGRLEDRPLRIRAELFPYRADVDVDRLLTWLHQQGFIVRYETIAGQKLISVTTFRKHQSPHHTERPSTLPAPTDGPPLNNGESTVSAPLSHDGNPPDSYLLITDSLIADCGPSKGADAPRAPARRATQLPEDFKPNDHHRTLAAELGVDLDSASAAFCDHARANGKTFKDWDAGFRTWLRNELKFGRRPAGSSALLRAAAGPPVVNQRPIHERVQAWRNKAVLRGVDVDAGNDILAKLTNQMREVAWLTRIWAGGVENKDTVVLLAPDEATADQAITQCGGMLAAITAAGYVAIQGVKVYEV